MPVVPVSEPQAVTPVRPTIRTSGQDFAPGVYESQILNQHLLSASNEIQSVAVDMQLRENADRVFRAETELKNAEREFLNQTNERRGIKAFGVTEEAEEWYSQQINTVSESLDNEHQRQMFAELAEQRRQVSLDSISSYEATQRRESFNESAGASISSSIEMAAMSAFNPVARNMERTRILETIGDLAASNGWTPEIRSQKESEAMTAMHNAVIDSIVNQSPKAALEYFKANKSEISATVAGELEAMLQASVMDFESQMLADKFFTDESSYDSAVEKVRTIEDPELRKLTREKVNQYYADAVNARQENEREATDQAWRTVAAGFHVNEIPANIWRQLPGDVQITLQDYDRAKTAAEIKPRTVDDYEVLNVVEEQIEEGLITDVGQLAQYQPYLRRETFDSLRDAVTKAAAGIPQDDIRKLYEERVGDKRPDWNDEQHSDYVLIQEYVNTRVKEGATPEDLESLVDRWFMEGYGLQDRALRNDPDTFAESYRAGRSDFIIKTPEVDSKLMQDSMTLLESHGVTVSKEKTALDEFYTKIGFDARRHFIRNGITATPNHIVAYAILKQAGEPVTTANVEYVMEQMK